MRLLLFFDLPTKTKQDLREYRSFVKYLKNDGYLRVQYSVSAKTAANRVKANAPIKGDIRFMVISENQYLSMVNVFDSYSMQEKITTTDRTLVIGGMNDED